MTSPHLHQEVRVGDIILPKDTCVLPAIGDESPMVLDLRKARVAQSRLFEISCLTAAKAGELLATFIEAWHEVRLLALAAARHVTRAKNYLNRVRAVIVLDEVAEELKRRGLASSRSPAGSEDLRKAVIDQHAQYQKALATLTDTEWLAAGLEADADQLKMAYFTVQKLADPRSDTSASLSGGTGDDEPGQLTERERAHAFAEKHAVARAENYGTDFSPPKL